MYHARAHTYTHTHIGFGFGVGVNMMYVFVFVCAFDCGYVGSGVGGAGGGVARYVRAQFLQHRGGGQGRTRRGHYHRRKRPGTV